MKRPNADHICVFVISLCNQRKKNCSVFMSEMILLRLVILQVLHHMYILHTTTTIC